jgi:hypothetical protein
MKSLSQIEPRTDVLTLPGDNANQYIISRSGSYYLSTNVVGANAKSGIAIVTNDVTLDLCGFSALGVPGSTHGVYISGGYTNIIVRNGIVSAWGNTGVYASTATARNLVLERLTVSANGFSGIYVFGSGVVRDCTAQGNSYNGLYCAGAFQVLNCSSRDNANFGIYVAPGSVSDCLVHNSGYSGIYVDAPGSQVIGNTCIGNNSGANSGHAGIVVNDARNRIENNHVSASGYAGILVSATYANNLIIKNSVIGSGTNNYVVPGAQIVGPLITNTGTITNSNPWANFSF